MPLRSTVTLEGDAPSAINSFLSAALTVMSWSAASIAAIIARRGPSNSGSRVYIRSPCRNDNRFAKPAPNTDCRDTVGINVMGVDRVELKTGIEHPLYVCNAATCQQRGRDRHPNTRYSQISGVVNPQAVPDFEPLYPRGTWTSARIEKRLEEK